MPSAGASLPRGCKQRWSEILSGIRWQIYNTVFIPKRWREYARILRSAQEAGYKFLTLEQLALYVQAGSVPPEPFLVLRHDIDTDARAASIFSQIESQLGIRSSYFFRLKTWNRGVVGRILDAGNEVGYHFEELATFAKHQHIRDRAKLLERLDEARQDLERNLQRLRKDFAIKSLASHGDFANRRLQSTNSILATDPFWREKWGILYEAYDPKLVAAYQNHVSDKPYPERFHPQSPLQHIQTKQNFLWLTHPRWWQPNPNGNLREAFIRLKEQLTW